MQVSQVSKECVRPLSITRLDLSENGELQDGAAALAEAFASLPSLLVFDVHGCRSLQSLPETISQVGGAWRPPSLKAHGVPSCLNLTLCVVVPLPWPP